MLGKLLKRQIQPGIAYTASGYVDSLGRVGRFSGIDNERPATIIRCLISIIALRVRKITVLVR